MKTYLIETTMTRIALLCMVSLLPLTTSVSPEREFGVNCSLRESCQLSPDVASPLMNCACDKQCHFYQDCCRDVTDTSFQFEGNSDRWTALASRMSCVRDDQLSWRYHVSMVTSCPTDQSQTEAAEQCERRQPASRTDRFLLIPVSDTSTGVLFRNVFCAVCNGVSDVSFWTVNITHSTSLHKYMKPWTSFRSILNKIRSRKSIFFQHAAFKVRPCKKNVISDCDPQWQNETTKTQCHSYTSYVYGDLTAQTFKNQFCATCNNLSPAEGHVHCIDPVHAMDTLPYRPFGGPFSLLLDINTGTMTSSEVGMKSVTITRTIHLQQNCGPGQIFDPLTDRCRLIWRGELNFTKSQDDSNEFEVHIDGFASCSMHAEQPCLPPIYQNIQNLTKFNITRTVVEKVSVEKFDQYLTYITIAGNLLSMCCLILHLGVYMAFQTLRNTPGKCVMCLSGSLLLAQALFTFGVAQTSIPWICRAIAVLLHYCFLTYFFWMNAMAFDIWHTLTSREQGIRSMPNKKQKSRRFCKFVLYSCLTPALIVCVSLVLDGVGAGGMSPRYGSSYCWFGSRKALLVLFASPLAVLLTADFVFFTRTVFHICAASEGSRFSQKGRDIRRRLYLYLKLALIMGLTWVFGFIAALSDVTAMWYVFEVLNTLQGVYICVAFVCTRKVTRLFSERWRDYRRVRTSSVEARTFSTATTVPSSTNTRHTLLSISSAADSRRTEHSHYKEAPM